MRRMLRDLSTLRSPRRSSFDFGMMGLAAALVAAPGLASTAFARDVDPVTVHVFHRDPIHFVNDPPESPDAPDTRAGPESEATDSSATSSSATPLVTSVDNGREIERTIRLPELGGDVRILARVRLHPIPKDAASVHDKWDRAGNVRLVVPDAPDVEIVKFITAYGGETTHEVDVTHLAPRLRGECTIRGFIDTWVSPAWKMDFALTYEPGPREETPEWMKEWIEEEDPGAPDWAIPLAYENVRREAMDEGDVIARVEVPAGTHRATLVYLVSGHCTDGRGADEFESKDNVISIDGEEVHRFRPWRDDCRSFRDVNPYCRRWFDGSWSADFARSGWCPGDAVLPETIDVTAQATPGEREFAFRVENVRPKDDSGHGYWRMSAVLVGWTD